VPITTLVSYSVQRVEVMDVEGNVDESLMPSLSGEQIKELYWWMTFARRFDERMLKLQRQGRMGTFARIYGQEGAHIPAGYALRKDDWMVPAFREAGAFLVRGMDPARFLQYWSGDERGNIFPEGVRMLPTSIPVGTHMLHACGLGWAMHRQGEKVAVLTSFGEGATSEGDFSEAMNFAAVFQCPVVLFCQNNQWAISVPYYRQTQSCTVAQKAIGYGMTGLQVDGNDAFAVYKVVSEALDRARQGLGPTLIEAYTYRMTDHTTSDDATRYRSEEEVAVWRTRDPILRLEKYMQRQGLLDETAKAANAARVEEVLADAVARWEGYGVPEPHEIFDYVYAQRTPVLAEQEAMLNARLAGLKGRR